MPSDRLPDFSKDRRMELLGQVFVRPGHKMELGILLNFMAMGKTLNFIVTPDLHMVLSSDELDLKEEADVAGLPLVRGTFKYNANSGKLVSFNATGNDEGLLSAAREKLRVFANTSLSSRRIEIKKKRY